MPRKRVRTTEQAVALFDLFELLERIQTDGDQEDALGPRNYVCRIWYCDDGLEFEHRIGSVEVLGWLERSMRQTMKFPAGLDYGGMLETIRKPDSAPALEWRWAPESVTFVNDNFRPDRWGILRELIRIAAEVEDVTPGLLRVMGRRSGKINAALSHLQFALRSLRLLKATHHYDELVALLEKDEE